MHVDISTWCRYIYIDDVDLSQADVDISTSDVDISTRKEKWERKRRTRRITSCCLLIMMILSWTVSGQTFSFTSTGEEKERMEGEENEKGEEKDKRSELCVQNATVFLVGHISGISVDVDWTNPNFTSRWLSNITVPEEMIHEIGGRIDDGWIGRHRWMDR